MLKYLLTIALVLCMSGCSTVGSTKLLVPSWFGFSEISEGVYVDDQMSPGQRQEFLKILSLAKERVSAFFSSIEASSKVFACSTEECFRFAWWGGSTSLRIRSKVKVCGVAGGLFLLLLLA